MLKNKILEEIELLKEFHSKNRFSMDAGDIDFLDGQTLAYDRVLFLLEEQELCLKDYLIIEGEDLVII